MVSLGGSAGSHLYRLMDSIGFSDQLKNVACASLDAAVGNNVRVAKSLFDAFLPLSGSFIERMTAGAFCHEGFFPRPHENYTHHFTNYRTTHYEREQISTYTMDALALQKGMTPLQFKSKLMADPTLRGTLEAQVGGRIVCDGKPDERITIARRLNHPYIAFAGNIHQNVAAMLNRCANPLNQQNVLQGIAAALKNAIPGFEPSAILNNPNLSFDQQLAQLFQGFMGKLQQQMLKKLEGLVQGGSIQAPKRKKKKKGIGGKLKKGLKGIKKGIGKFGKIANGLGKGLGKGVFKTITGGFLKGGLLKGLLSGKLGMIFQLGTGLLGGIIGGPIGSSLIGQIAKGKIQPKNLLKAANPFNQMKAMMTPKQLVSMQLHQAFGQVTEMFQMVNAFSRGITDVQRQAFTHRLRG